VCENAKTWKAHRKLEASRVEVLENSQIVENFLPIIPFLFSILFVSRHSMLMMCWLKNQGLDTHESRAWEAHVHC
jgi:hypothetical protein